MVDMNLIHLGKLYRTNEAEESPAVVENRHCQDPVSFPGVQRSDALFFAKIGSTMQNHGGFREKATDSVHCLVLCVSHVIQQRSR